MKPFRALSFLPLFGFTFLAHAEEPTSLIQRLRSELAVQSPEGVCLVKKPPEEFFLRLKALIKAKSDRSAETAFSTSKQLPDAENFAKNFDWKIPDSVKSTVFTVYSPFTEPGGGLTKWGNDKVNGHGVRIRTVEEAIADQILFREKLTGLPEDQTKALGFRFNAKSFIESPARYATVAISYPEKGGEGTSQFPVASRLRLPAMDLALRKMDMDPIEFKALDGGGAVRPNQIDIAISKASGSGLETPESLDTIVTRFHESIRFFFLSEKKYNETKDRAPEEIRYKLDALSAEQRKTLRSKLTTVLFGRQKNGGPNEEEFKAPVIGPDGVYGFLGGLTFHGPVEKYAKPVLVYRDRYSTQSKR